jgi:hypothetical protein
VLLAARPRASTPTSGQGRQLDHDHARSNLLQRVNHQMIMKIVQAGRDLYVLVSDLEEPGPSMTAQTVEFGKLDTPGHDIAAQTVTCNYDRCLTPIIQRIGRGRPRKFCPVHASQRKREQDQARAKTRDRSSPNQLPECCAEYVADHPRSRQCPQHRDWRRFNYASRKWTGTARDEQMRQDAIGWLSDGFSIISS